MASPPKLLIFDCDGVLVDSEPIFNRVLHTVLTSHGATLTFDESTDKFVGTNRYVVEKYMQSQGTPLPQNWSQSFYITAIETLSREVTAINGIAAALKTIAATGIPMCVASNGQTAKMIATLTKTNLLHFFENKLYSGYDMAAGKPAPDLFLHAAAHHKTDPKDCIVIEDSPSGFAAAQAANMPCLAYVPIPDQTKPLFNATPFTSMSNLPKLLNLHPL